MQWVVEKPEIDLTVHDRFQFVSNRFDDRKQAHTAVLIYYKKQDHRSDRNIHRIRDNKYTLWAG